MLLGKIWQGVLSIFRNKEMERQLLESHKVILEIKEKVDKLESELKKVKEDVNLMLGVVKGVRW